MSSKKSKATKRKSSADSSAPAAKKRKVSTKKTEAVTFACDQKGCEALEPFSSAFDLSAHFAATPAHRDLAVCAKCNHTGEYKDDCPVCQAPWRLFADHPRWNYKCFNQCKQNDGDKCRICKKAYSETRLRRHIHDSEECDFVCRQCYTDRLWSCAGCGIDVQKSTSVCPGCKTSITGNPEEKKKKKKAATKPDAVLGMVSNKAKAAAKHGESKTDIPSKPLAAKSEEKKVEAEEEEGSEEEPKRKPRGLCSACGVRCSRVGAYCECPDNRDPNRRMLPLADWWNIFSATGKHVSRSKEAKYSLTREQKEDRAVKIGAAETGSKHAYSRTCRCKTCTDARLACKGCKGVFHKSFISKHDGVCPNCFMLWIPAGQKPAWFGRQDCSKCKAYWINVGKEYQECPYCAGKLCREPARAPPDPSVKEAVGFPGYKIVIRKGDTCTSCSAQFMPSGQNMCQLCDGIHVRGPAFEIMARDMDKCKGHCKEDIKCAFCSRAFSDLGEAWHVGGDCRCGLGCKECYLREYWHCPACGSDSHNTLHPDRCNDCNFERPRERRVACAQCKELKPSSQIVAASGICSTCTLQADLAKLPSKVGATAVKSGYPVAMDESDEHPFEEKLKKRVTRSVTAAEEKAKAEEAKKWPCKNCGKMGKHFGGVFCSMCDNPKCIWYCGKCDLVVHQPNDCGKCGARRHQSPGEILRGKACALCDPKDVFYVTFPIGGRRPDFEEQVICKYCAKTCWQCGDCNHFNRKDDDKCVECEADNLRRKLTPALSCPVCPQLFLQQYQLADHAYGQHAELFWRCWTFGCGNAVNPNSADKCTKCNKPREKPSMIQNEEAKASPAGDDDADVTDVTAQALTRASSVSEIKTSMFLYKTPAHQGVTETKLVASVKGPVEVKTRVSYADCVECFGVYEKKCSLCPGRKDREDKRRASGKCEVVNCDREATHFDVCEEHQGSWLCACGYAFDGARTGCFECGTSGDDEAWMLDDPHSEMRADLNGWLEHCYKDGDKCPLCDTAVHGVGHFTENHGYRFCTDPACHNKNEAFSPHGLRTHHLDKHPKYKACKGCFVVLVPEGDYCEACIASEPTVVLTAPKTGCPEPGCTTRVFHFDVEPHAFKDHPGKYWQCVRAKCGILVSVDKKKCPCGSSRAIHACPEPECFFAWTSFVDKEHVAKFHDHKDAGCRCDKCDKDNKAHCARCRRLFDKRTRLERIGMRLLCKQCAGLAWNCPDHKDQYMTQAHPCSKCAETKVGDGSMGLIAQGLASDSSDRDVSTAIQQMLATKCRACTITEVKIQGAMCETCRGRHWICTKCDTTNMLGSDQVCCKCTARWRCPVKGCNKAPFISSKALAEHALDGHNWDPCPRCKRVKAAKRRRCDKCPAASGGWICSKCDSINKDGHAECQNYKACPSHTQVPDSEGGEWFCYKCTKKHGRSVQRCEACMCDDKPCKCPLTFPEWVMGEKPRIEPYEFQCSGCDFFTDDPELYKEHQHWVHGAWGMEGAAST